MKNQNMGAKWLRNSQYGGQAWSSGGQHRDREVGEDGEDAHTLFT